MLAAELTSAWSRMTTNSSSPCRPGWPAKKYSPAPVAHTTSTPARPSRRRGVSVAAAGALALPAAARPGKAQQPTQQKAGQQAEGQRRQQIEAGIEQRAERAPQQQWEDHQRHQDQRRGDATRPATQRPAAQPERNGQDNDEQYGQDDLGDGHRLGVGEKEQARHAEQRGGGDGGGPGLIGGALAGQLGEIEQQQHRR